MKSVIVGWLYLIGAAIFLLGFIGLTLVPILTSGGVLPSEIKQQLLMGVVSLVIGVSSFILGSSIRAHKNWSWYLAMILIPLALIGNLVSLVMAFQPFLLLPLLLNVFSIYALIDERRIFIT